MNTTTEDRRDEGCAPTAGSATPRCPNQRIRSEITAEDAKNGSGVSTVGLAEECLRSLLWGCPYSTTFVESIPYALRPAVEKEMKEKFERWASTWIAPKLRQIIAKRRPPQNAGQDAAASRGHPSEIDG